MKAPGIASPINRGRGLGGKRTLYGVTESITVKRKRPYAKSQQKVTAICEMAGAMDINENQPKSLFGPQTSP